MTEKPFKLSYLPADSTGFKVWHNKGNGFCVVELHYSADPAKRDPAWKARESQGMPAAEWNREYELSWETHGGLPVYGKEFNEAIHVLPTDREPVYGLPLIRGWDFGLNQTCLVTQVVGNRLHVVRELISEGVGSVRFVPYVTGVCEDTWPDYHFIDIIDPSGEFREQATETACADVMRENGLVPLPGDQNPERRRNAVFNLLLSNSSGKPCLQVNPSCRVVIQGFKGGYQFAEIDKNTKRTTKQLKPIKNEFSHVHDALQYIATRVKGFHARAQAVANITIEEPNYNFLGDTGE